MFLGITAAYLGSATGVWHITPDSAIYRELARSLAQGAGYQFNLAPFAKYPPVFPAMLAIVRRLAGPGVWPAQAMLALCGVGALAAAFGLVRARAGVRAALAVVLLSAACSWFWLFSSVYILSEMPFTLFTLGALALAERELRKPAFSLLGWLPVVLLAMAAIYTHLFGVALIPTLAGAILWARGPARPLRSRLWAAGALAVVCTAAAAAWVAWSWLVGGPGSYEGNVKQVQGQSAASLWAKLLMRLTEWAATPLGVSHSRVEPVWGALMLALFLLPGLAAGLRRFRSCAEFYLAASFVLSAAVGGEHGHERYVVPLVPLLFYFGYLSLAAGARGVRAAMARLRGATAREASPGLPWPVAAVAFLAIFLPALYQRATYGGPAGRFSRREIARDAARLRAWEEAREMAEPLLPPDARLCASSMGSWSIAAAFIRRSFHYGHPPEDRGAALLRSIDRSGATFVLGDRRERTQATIVPLLAQHPECFPFLWGNRECWVHRVDRAKLAELVARLPAAALPDASPPPPTPEEAD